MAMTYQQALAEAKSKGVGRCSDAAAMAQFCDANIHVLVGAVSAQLVWEGAQAKRMTFRELGRLYGSNPRAVEALQWEA